MKEQFLNINIIMIMKKLNNRQNQVKSLDFNTQANLLFNLNHGVNQQNNIGMQQQQQVMMNGGNGQNAQYTQNIANGAGVRSPQIIKTQQPVPLHNQGGAGVAYHPQHSHHQSQQIPINAGSGNEGLAFISQQYSKQQLHAENAPQTSIHQLLLSQHQSQKHGTLLKPADSQKVMVKAAFPYTTTQGNLIGAGIGFPQPALKTLNATDSLQSMQSVHNASAGPNPQQQKLIHAAALAANASAGGHIFIDMPSNKLTSTGGVSGAGTGNKKISTKAQKIKIGMHKKAVSIAGQIPSNSLANKVQSLDMNQTQQTNLAQSLASQQVASVSTQQSLKHSNSRKKAGPASGGHSKQNSISGGMPLSTQSASKTGPNGSSNQTSMHEYSTNNNNIIVMNYGGDVQIFPKIDNFIIGGPSSPEKLGPRTPSSEQKILNPQLMGLDQAQLMQMKNYQRIINEAAQSSNSKVKPISQNSASKQKNTEQKGYQKQTQAILDQHTQQQLQVLKSSFDSNSRPPLGHPNPAISQSTTGNPSQRISIISSTIDENSSASQGGQPELGYMQLNHQSRAQVHYQHPQPMSMPLKLANTIQAHAQLKMTQARYPKVSETSGATSAARDSEIQLNAQNSSPSNQFFLSAQMGNARQVKKSLQNHHLRTFSDIPANQALLTHQQAKNQNILLNDHSSHGGTATLNSGRGTFDQHAQQSINSYDDNKHLSETRAATASHHTEYQPHRKIVKNNVLVQSIDANSGQHKNSLLGAIQTQHQAASSRQMNSKTQNSSQLTDEREALMQLIKHATTTSNHQQSPSLTQNEMKHIYQGMLKEQIQKTKHALKLTQNQIGSSGNHSRKVVSSAANKLNGGANTQSFRISQQVPNIATMAITQSQLGQIKDPSTMMLMTAGMNSLQKMTPKLNLNKNKKSSKQLSGNNSSAGARGSANATKIQNAVNAAHMVFLNEGKLAKVLQQVQPVNSRAQEASAQNKNLKGIFTASPGHMRAESLGYDFNNSHFTGGLLMSELMARTSVKGPNPSQNPLLNSIEANSAMIQATNPAGQVMQINPNAHKRSISDGNSIFQSMISNRAQQQIMVPIFENNQGTQPGQIYKSINGSQKKTKQKLNTNGQSSSLTRPVAFHGGINSAQHEYLRSTYQKEAMTKITNGPYDQILFQQQPTLQDINPLTLQSDRPQSGVRANSYVMNPSSHRSQHSQGARAGSHRHIEVNPSNRISSAAPVHGKSHHMRTQSHQITIESNRERSERDNNMVVTPSNMGSLPRPPAPGHHKNQLSMAQPGRRDNQLGVRRPSSKNAGEIVIEDQGTTTPKYQAFASTPQSINEETLAFETGAPKTRKMSAKNQGKDRLINVANPKDLKKKSSSRRASVERERKKSIQSEREHERFDTHDSTISDPNLSPRTRKNVKLARIVRLAFKKTQNPPVTSSDFYKIGKVMGKGAFGKVNLAIHRLSRKFVALKSINKTFLSEEASKRKVMQEFNILQRTRHKNIVRLYESFETPQHIVFVMEVCGAGDLLTYVRRRRKLKEDVAKHLFKQIVEGLRYCHTKGVLHRDIKLDNILLTSEGNIKICDFGVSKLTRANELMKEQCGTPAYIAPEVFEGNGYEGYASDVWSAGVVLYAMLYGTVPFKASNMTELQKQICKGNTTFKDEISSESINLLQSILEKDPKKRISIDQILRHPWMQNIPKNINVFTDQEKEKTDQEFAYYNMKADGEGLQGEILQTDPFADQMSLNSTQNSLVKNVSTKSVILAPFNSTRTHIDENFHLHDSVQDLMVDKKVFKFAAKVKEVDRQYEANNNAELDNGVYHQEEGEEEKKEPSPLRQQNTPPFGDGQGLDDESLQKEIEEGQKQKKQSEWQKIERMMDKQRIEDERTESRVHQLMVQAQVPLNFTIDNNVLSDMEKNGGYPKEYVSQSLKNDELNYATAYYYLLCTPKEF